MSKTLSCLRFSISGGILLIKLLLKTILSKSLILKICGGNYSKKLPYKSINFNFFNLANESGSYLMPLYNTWSYFKFLKISIFFGIIFRIPELNVLIFFCIESGVSVGKIRFQPKINFWRDCGCFIFVSIFSKHLFLLRDKVTKLFIESGKVIYVI